MTSIALNPLDSGSSPIKSIEMCSQGVVGTSFGCKGLCGFSRRGLVLWHASHPFMYFRISDWMHGHQ